MKTVILNSRNALRGTLPFFAGVLLFGALAWAGDEPWRGKPYQQWDDQDLQQVFTHSPWGRTIALTRTWLPLSAKDFPDKSPNGSAKKLPVQAQQSGGNTLGVEVDFNVYWVSSRVMRAASARRAALHGENKEVDVEKYASEPQDEIQIVVQSQDMAPFIRKDERFFQANAYLQMRKTKQKVSPSHVRYEHGDDDRIVTAVVFFFPKKSPSGDPTIATGEKSVEFTCKIEGSTLRVNFEPQKMADQSGPAL